jgi:hypothetical protein
LRALSWPPRCARRRLSPTTLRPTKYRARRGRPSRTQGNWTNATITPFERPEKYNQLALTEQEAGHGARRSEINATADAPMIRIPRSGPADELRPRLQRRDCGPSLLVDPGTKLISLNGQRRTSMLVVRRTVACRR